MNNTKLSPPWYNYVSEINALFGEDPDIKIGFDQDALELKLLVDNTDKASALEELLPSSVQFGNVELKVFVIPANDMVVRNNARLFELAFKGNPIVSEMVDVPDVLSNPVTYIAFRKEVVQYYNDDLGDLYGNRSTLMQEIAKEVFSDHDEGIFFCTDSGEE